jgi:FkbM family methyltransferase
VEIQRGPAAGLRIQLAGTSVGTALGINEPEVLDVLVSHVIPGSTFYDVGANVGYFTLVGARLVGPAGRVCAFEPVPATAAVLAANVAMNDLRHVTVHEVAAAATSGRARFELGEESVRARLAAERPHEPASNTAEVALAALDTLVEDGVVPPPHFIKMDIEGAEVAALQGLRKTLRRHRPHVLVEVHGTQREVVALLRDAGYEVVPVEAEGPAEAVPDFTHVLASPVAPTA